MVSECHRSTAEVCRHFFTVDDLQADLRNHAIRSGGVTVLSRLLTFVVTTFSAIVLARLLTPTDFGLAAMVTALGGFLVIFIADPIPENWSALELSLRPI